MTLQDAPGRAHRPRTQLLFGLVASTARVPGRVGQVTATDRAFRREEAGGESPPACRPTELQRCPVPGPDQIGQPHRS